MNDYYSLFHFRNKKKTRLILGNALYFIFKISINNFEEEEEEFLPPLPM